MANFNVTACCGYAIMAMERAGMPDDKITEVMVELTMLFGDVTEEEAVEKFITTDK